MSSSGRVVIIKGQSKDRHVGGSCGLNEFVASDGFSCGIHGLENRMAGVAALWVIRLLA